MTELYIPNQLIFWHPDELQLRRDGIDAPNTIGYIPVYENLELLRKDFPDANYSVQRWNGERRTIDDTDIRPH